MIMEKDHISKALIDIDVDKETNIQKTMSLCNKQHLSSI